MNIFGSVFGSAAGGFSASSAFILGVNPVVTAAGTTVASSTDQVIVFTGSTTHTLTLPACATGRILFLKDRSTGAITVNRAGSDTIDNAGTSLTLNADDAVILIGNGTNWMVF